MEYMLGNMNQNAKPLCLSRMNGAPLRELHSTPVGLDLAANTLVGWLMGELDEVIGSCRTDVMCRALCGNWCLLREIRYLELDNYSLTA